MSLSNTKKSQALRKRRAALGLKEMRNIWLTDAEEIIIKKEIRQRLKELRNETAYIKAVKDQPP